MRTIEYLNKVKQAKGITSDYALAKALGMTRSGISSLVNGKNTMSDETAMKAAEILGINAGIVVIDMHLERSKSDSERNIWKDVAKGFLLLLLPAKIGAMA